MGHVLMDRKVLACFVGVVVTITIPVARSSKARFMTL
jgi:hypothetical protein